MAQKEKRKVKGEHAAKEERGASKRKRKTGESQKTKYVNSSLQFHILKHCSSSFCQQTGKGG